MELENDNTVEPPTKKLKYCSGWPRSKQAHFVRISQEADSDAAVEETKNELSHVLQMQRDHPFEGSSNPVAQVTLRCNVDVKYLGRGIATEDLELLGQSIDAKRAATTLYQLLVDMTRDMQDVQWYTGEYAAKKFELSRDMLPELYAGVKRLEEEDAQRPAQVSADRLPLTVTQGQALKILRRLAFAMQRCVSKANNELAYQVLYEQEQYVTYQTYDVFMGYVYMSMHDARRMELEELKNQHPNLVVRSLLVQTDSQTTEEEQWVSLDTMAEVEVLQDSVMKQQLHKVRNNMVMRLSLGRIKRTIFCIEEGMFCFRAFPSSCMVVMCVESQGNTLAVWTTYATFRFVSTMFFSMSMFRQADKCLCMSLFAQCVILERHHVGTSWNFECTYCFTTRMLYSLFFNMCMKG